MFTDQDFKEYFEQIAGLERLMIYRVYDLLPLIDEAAVRGPLEQIVADEKRHYGYIRGVFDSVLFKSDIERRKFIREHVLGKAQVRMAGRDRFWDGYCVDLSGAGACIEFEQKVPLAGDVEVRIEPFTGDPVKHYKGRLAWSAEINPRLQIGNIKFKAGVEFSGTS